MQEKRAHKQTRLYPDQYKPYCGKIHEKRCATGVLQLSYVKKTVLLLRYSKTTYQLFRGKDSIEIDTRNREKPLKNYYKIRQIRG
jgi:hypothetical protein